MTHVLANHRRSAPRRRYRRFGWSLLDAAVVFFVAAIGLGLLLAFLGRLRESGNRVACTNNLRRIGAAFQTYGDLCKQAGGNPFAHGEAALPPSRIADRYATWAVLLVPMIQANHPLERWDLAKPFEAQQDEVRRAVATFYVCPVRARTTGLAGDDPRRGTVGDFAGASGDGDLPNGAMIPAAGVVKTGDAIVRWSPPVALSQLKRGLAATILVGEKHVPRGRLGDSEAGDGPIVDGALPESHVRRGGASHPLAPKLDDPAAPVFGSWHGGVSSFLFASGNVQTMTNDVSPELLGRLIRLEE